MRIKKEKKNRKELRQDLAFTNSLHSCVRQGCGKCVFFFGNIFYKIYLKSVKRDATLSTKSIQSDNFQLSKIDLNC